MDKMVFEIMKSDPNVGFCSAIQDNGTDYYQYVLHYTDNIMAIMKKPEDFIFHELGKIFLVKLNSIRPPTRYLRNKVSYFTLENGRNEWSFSSSHYVKDNVKNIIDTLAQEGRILP